MVLTGAVGETPEPIPEDPEDPLFWLDVVVTEMCDPEDGRDIVSEYAESVSCEGSHGSSPLSEGG